MSELETLLNFSLYPHVIQNILGQQMQQLGAKDAEIAALRARVEELEKELAARVKSPVKMAPVTLSPRGHWEDISEEEEVGSDDNGTLSCERLLQLGDSIAASRGRDYGRDPSAEAALGPLQAGPYIPPVLRGGSVPGSLVPFSQRNKKWKKDLAPIKELINQSPGVSLQIFETGELLWENMPASGYLLRPPRKLNVGGWKPTKNPVTKSLNGAEVILTSSGCSRRYYLGSFSISDPTVMPPEEFRSLPVVNSSYLVKKSGSNSMRKDGGKERLQQQYMDGDLSITKFKLVRVGYDTRIERILFPDGLPEVEKSTLVL